MTPPSPVPSAAFSPNPFDDALRRGSIQASDLLAFAVNLHELVASNVASICHMAQRHGDGELGAFYRATADGEGEGLRLLASFVDAARDAAAGADPPAVDALAQAYPAYVARIAISGAPPGYLVCYLHLWRASTQTYRALARTLEHVSGFGESDLRHFAFFGDTDPELTALAEEIAGRIEPAARTRGLQLAHHLHLFEELFWRRMVVVCTPAAAGSGATRSVERPSAATSPCRPTRPHHAPAPETTGDDAPGRAARVVRLGGYLSLATADPAGLPWVAQLQYAWHPQPFSFVFGSSTESQHAADLRQSSRAAAAISLLPAAHERLDGVQLTGTCAPLRDARLSTMRGRFYTQLFPDPEERLAYELPTSRLAGAAPQRLFELTVERLWLLDLQRWEDEQICARTEVDPSEVATRLRSGSSHGR